MAEAVSDFEQKYGRLAQLTLVIDMNRCLVSRYIYLLDMAQDAFYIHCSHPYPYSPSLTWIMASQCYAII